MAKDPLFIKTRLGPLYEDFPNGFHLECVESPRAQDCDYITDHLEEVITLVRRHGIITVRDSSIDVTAHEHWRQPGSTGNFLGWHSDPVPHVVALYQNAKDVRTYPTSFAPTHELQQSMLDYAQDFAFKEERVRVRVQNAYTNPFDTFFARLFDSEYGGRARGQYLDNLFDIDQRDDFAESEVNDLRNFLRSHAKAHSHIVHTHDWQKEQKSLVLFWSGFAPQKKYGDATFSRSHIMHAGLPPAGDFDHGEDIMRRQL